MPTVTRTILMPILKPLPPQTWPEFGADLRTAWKLAMHATNKMTAMLVATDLQQHADEGKLPAFPKVNTYRFGTQEAPHLPTGTVSQLDRYMRRRYTGKNSKGQRVRWAVHVGQQACPNSTRDVLPIRAQDWKYGLLPSGEAFVDVPILRVSDGVLKRYKLILKSGKEFARQYAIFKSMCDGTIKSRDIKIIQKSVGSTGAMPAVVIAVDLPVRENRGDGVITVRTASDTLLDVFAPQRTPPLWRYHAEHVRRWMAEHRRHAQAMANDAKFEPRQERGTLAPRRAVFSLKYNNRMNTMIDDVSRYVVNLVQRQHAATVEWDDAVRWPGGEVPYAALKAKIMQKCELEGIGFSDITVPAVKAGS